MTRSSDVSSPTRRRVGLLGAVIVLALGISGCAGAASPTDRSAGTAGGTESTPASEPVDVLRVATVANPVQAAVVVGLDDAALDGLATTVETTLVTNPDEFRTGLTAGRFDAATLPTDVAANLSTRDIDVRLVGIIDAKLLQLIGPTGSAGWESLRSRTVHVAFKGDVADLVLQELAAHHGLVAGVGFTIEYHTALPELAAAAAGGTASYLVLPQPMATAAVQQAAAAGHQLAPVLDLQDEWKTATGSATLPQSALVVTGTFADAHPELVAALARHAAKQVAAIGADPAGAADAIVATTKLPAPMVTMVLPKLSIAFLAPHEARADLDRFFAVLLERSPASVGGRAPSESFFGG